MLRRFATASAVVLLGVVVVSAPAPGPPARERPGGSRPADVATAIPTCTATPERVEFRAEADGSHCSEASPRVVARSGFTIPEC